MMLYAERLRGFVAQQDNGFIERTQDQVRPAVVIEIADSQPTTEMDLLKIRASCGRPIHKPALALIAEQHRLLSPRGQGRATDHMAVADHQVLPAVIIHVEKAG